MELILNLAHLPVDTDAVGYRPVLDAAVAADRAGADLVSLTDHVLLGENLDSHAALGGDFPWPSDHPYPEPLLLLAAVAAATTSVRLTTGIVIAPLRPAALLAKLSATLDVLSQGRFELGVGSGWQAEEFEALGVPLAEAARRTEDAVVACRALWTEEAATVDLPSVSFTRMYCRPQPHGGRRLPVWWAGGDNRATARRIARLGDGWLPLLAEPAAVRRGRALLDEECELIGRDPDEVGIRGPLLGRIDGDPGPVRDRIEELRSCGVTGVFVSLCEHLDGPEPLGEAAERVAETWRGLVPRGPR